jgi:hypothetical protein
MVHLRSIMVHLRSIMVHLRSIPQVDHLRHRVAKHVGKPVSLLRMFCSSKPIKTIDSLSDYIGRYFTYAETKRETNARQAWNRCKRGDGTSTSKYHDYFTKQFADVKKCALPLLLAICGDIG